MGVDVIALSKAVGGRCRIVTKQDDVECLERHTTMGTISRKRDGLRRGCYVCGIGGTEIDFRAGSGLGYSTWIDALCEFAVSLPPQVPSNGWRSGRLPFTEPISFPSFI